MSLVATAYRRTVLGIADLGVVRSTLQRYGRRIGVQRFVAGAELGEALPALRELEASGRGVILDLLGEFVGDRDATASITQALVDTVERIASEPTIDLYLSVKPTQLGLGIDPDLAHANATRVVEAAAAHDGHVCFDMENVPYVDGTLALIERLHADGHRTISTVLQSYLYRTPDDLERLLALSPAPPIRMVKGAYRESPEHAYQDKADVDEAFRDLTFRLLDAGTKANVATHDERILDEVAAYVRGAGIGPERYAFQLLFGVKPQLQARLVEAGHEVQIYVPYGEDWYGYFSRRIAERPANLGFVLRGLVG